VSLYQFFASRTPIRTIENPYLFRFSINEFLAMGMEIPFNLQEKSVDRDEKIFFVCESEELMDEISTYITQGSPMADFEKISGMTHFAVLEWRYTEKRAEDLIRYMSTLVDDLDDGSEIEFWHVWMDDPLEGLETRTYNVEELTVFIIRELFGNECYDHPICLKLRKA